MSRPSSSGFNRRRPPVSSGGDLRGRSKNVPNRRLRHPADCSGAERRSHRASFWANGWRRGFGFTSRMLFSRARRFPFRDLRIPDLLHTSGSIARIRDGFFSIFLPSLSYLLTYLKSKRLRTRVPRAWRLDDTMSRGRDEIISDVRDSVRARHYQDLIDTRPYKTKRRVVI